MPDPTARQQAWAEALEANLEGLEAVSTGLCPGCDDCRADWPDYQPDDEGYDHQTQTDWPAPWHVPAIPGRYFASEAEAEAAAREAFEDAWSSGAVYAEPSFSWRGCDLCPSTLGGDFEPWHAIDAETGRLIHGDRACVDCIMFLANGDYPDDDHLPGDRYAVGAA